MQDPATAPITTREPLAIRGAIIAFITALLHLAVMNGWLDMTAEIEQQTLTIITLGIDLIGIAALVVWARGKVTPVDAPRLPEIGDPDTMTAADRG